LHFARRRVKRAVNHERNFPFKQLETIRVLSFCET
jgi:hypothetical protein